MKPKSTLRSYLAIVGSSLLAISYSHAADGTWDTDAAGNWTDITNWLGNAAYASGTDSTATLGNFITVNRIITLDAAITIGNITASDTSHNYTISGANILTLDRSSGIPTIDVTSGRTLTISSQIAGLDGLQKIGLGTLTLTGANSYTGDTTITNSTLNLGGATATGSLASTVINLANGTLTYTRTGGTTQTFTTTNIKAGASTASTVATNTLNLGDLTRDVGGTLNFGNLGSIITSEANTTSGIIGGWATFNNANWAVANGGSAITGGATYYTTTTGGTTGANYTNVRNMDVSGSVTMVGTINPSTIRFNVAGVSTVTLAAGDNIIASGGILVTSTVGNNLSTITGGNLAGSSGGDLIIHQHNSSNALTIGSIIKNNGGATGLTKSGAGTLFLSGDNSYTGVTYINAGVIEISHANALGTTAGNTIIAGTGQLKPRNSINTPENISITGTGTAIFNNGGTSTTLSGDITLDNPTGGIIFSTANGGSKLVFAGTITQLGTSRDLTLSTPSSGGQGITIDNPIANNGGRLLITGGSASLLKGVNATDGTGIGETVISSAAGTVAHLKLGVSDALNTTANLTIGSTVAGTNDGKFDLASFSQTVNALIGNGTTATNSTRIVTNSVNGTSTLTVGNGGGTGTFNGTIQNTDALKIVALIKTGIGAQTLTGVNTYTGGTTITGGNLVTALPTNLAGYTVAGKVIINGGRLDVTMGDGTTTGWTTTQVDTLLTNATRTSGSLGINTANGDLTQWAAFDSAGNFGGLGLTKLGANTLTLDQTNTYSGGTTIGNSGGILKITTSTALGSGDVSILTQSTNTGTLELALTGTNSIAKNFTTNSASTLTTAGANAHIMNTSGDNTISGTITVTNGGGNGTNIVSNGGLLTLAGTITSNYAPGPRTLSLGGSGNGVVSGTITDDTTNSLAFTVVKSGVGTWTLSNASNGYTGLTSVPVGTLIAGSNAPSGAVGAFGNAISEISLGQAGGNSDASILIGGAFTVGRKVRTATSDTTDAGTRVLTLGGNTAHNSEFSGDIFLGTASRAGRGVTLTAANGGQVTFSGVIQDPGSMDATVYTVTKAGLGTVVLSNANTYTGATNVSEGKLLINGDQSAANGAVTVAAGTVTDTPVATLGGTGNGTTGRIGGNVSLAAESAAGFKNGGVLSPTAAADGTKLSVVGTTTFGAGSIFAWNMSATNPASDPGAAPNPGSYGQLAGTGAITGTGSDAVFKIVLGVGNAFTDAFWSSNKTWDNIFTGAGATTNLTSIFSSFGGTDVSTTGVVSGIGQFSFTGTSTLNWTFTAVPEPTSALAGLLLGAGLLRRRRK